MSWPSKLFDELPNALIVLIVLLMAVWLSACGLGTASPLSSTAGWIAFSNGADIYLVNADNGQLIRLASPDPDNEWGGTQPSWSPDGKQLAFTNWQTIFVISADGSNLFPLVTLEGRLVQSPQWSPDGKEIAFSSYTIRETEIYPSADLHIINTDGSNLRSTSLGCHREYRFGNIWSLDSQKIVYAYCLNGHTFSNYAIVVRDRAFTTEQWLTKRDWNCGDDCVVNYEPVWSPDDRYIAFTSWRDETPNIYVMNVDGSTQTHLTSDLFGDGGAIWSSDSQKIVFTSSQGLGNSEICVMNADGRDQSCLTHNSVYDHSPVWSPDGKRIVFISERDGDKQLYIMNADGSNQVRLTNNMVYVERPVWSPQIADN